MPGQIILVVDVPDSRREINHVVSSHEPLRRNPLAKLPLGSVRARGWIARQLELMVGGMAGRLQEISPFLGDDNGWLGTDKDGWEEQAYWLRGFYGLGVLTGDARIRRESARWIEAIISSRQEDGYFGPRCQKRVVGTNGKHAVDLWPHMVMLDALRSHWEVTGDQRVVDLASAFFGFCARIPDDEFIPPWDSEFGSWRPFIQWPRAGDMLPHIYWLYSLTGEQWLLGVATRFHEAVSPPEVSSGRMEDSWTQVVAAGYHGGIVPPKGNLLCHHVVNFTQRFREPGTYFVQSKDPAHIAETEHWYDTHMAEWGQQPGGGFAADENVRAGKTDPKQGFETCAMVEFNKSFYILGQITGQSLYADRVEEIAFNSFPVSHTPDLMALHYLTAPNQPQLDSGINHDYQNKGRLIDYSPHIYRCCIHDATMGWPYFVEHMWMAAAGNGLAAWIYGPCEVTAKVGSGEEVSITEETAYPFDTSVRLTFAVARQVAFPLYLRVPSWCRDFAVSVNGVPVEAKAEPGKYLLIDRTWSDGDVVTIAMPVELSLKTWAKSGNSVTVSRGPLSYSLKIEEDWRKMDTGTAEWPEWEVFPASPWNYGLVLSPDQPAGSFEVLEKGSVADQPWTVENAPIEIRARAKRIPNWTLIDDTVTDLQAGPIRSDEPEEDITLIPMGCARLRMSCLPVIGEGENPHEWQRVSSHEEAMLLRTQAGE